MNECIICNQPIKSPLDQFGRGGSPTCMRCWMAFGEIRVKAYFAHDYVRCPQCAARADHCSRCGGAGWVRVSSLTASDIQTAAEALEEWEVASVEVYRLAERVAAACR